jgi:hypothetical protein
MCASRISSTVEYSYLLGAVDAGADWHADVDAAFARDAGGVAHADATEPAGHALQAATRRLAVRRGRRPALEVPDPLQNPADGAEALPMAYARHGEMADVTSPQLIAEDAVSAATSTARMATTMASRRAIILLIVIE